MMAAGQVDLPARRQGLHLGQRSDDRLIRSSAVSYKVPCITNMAAAAAAVQAIATVRRGPIEVASLQERCAGRGA
jgi:carbamoyl-phosphate synthase large subunit